MRKMCQLQQFVTWDRSFRHMDRRTCFLDVVKASFEDFERANVVVPWLPEVFLSERRNRRGKRGFSRRFAVLCRSRREKPQASR